MKKLGFLTLLLFTLTSFSFGQTAKDYSDRGAQAYKNKQYAEAIQLFTQAINLSPNSHSGWFNRGQAYFYSGNYDLAIADYSQTLRLNPSHLVALVQRGLAYDKKGFNDAAIADYSRRLELTPTEAEIWYNRGIAYSNKNNLDAAMADYNQALKLNPNYTKAFVNRGSVYFRKKQYELALADVNAALKLDPNYAEAYANRGACYSEMNQHDLGIADLTQSLKLAPNYDKAYLARAIVYYRKRLHDSALTDLNQAIKLDPKLVDAYVLRGDIYVNTRKYDLAKTDLEKVLQLAPGHKFATDALAKINALAPTPAPSPTNSSPKSQAVWTGVSATNGIDTSVLRVGEENGQRLPLCRAAYNGGTHPGKIVNGRCHFGYGGAEVNVATFEVLTATANPSFSLNTTGNGDKFIVGAESNGQPLYLCSGAYQNGTHPGKIVNGKCNITYGGSEVSLASFNIYYFPAKTTPAPVNPAAINANSVEGYIQKVQTQYQAKQMRDAITTATVCIAAHPDAAPCYNARGQVYLQLAIAKPLKVSDRANNTVKTDPDWLAAVADLTKAIELAPNHADHFYQRAFIYYRSDGFKLEPYELAQADLKKALALNPNHAPAKALVPKLNAQHASKLFSDGNHKVLQGQIAASTEGKAKESVEAFNAAIQFLTKAIELDKSYLYLKRRGEAYLGLKNYDLAIADYTEAIKIKPDNAAALNLRAYVYVRQKNYPLALADYEKVSAMPENSDTKYEKVTAAVAKGDLHLEMGKYDFAIAEYTKVIATMPDHAVAFQGRGLAYFKKGETKAADADFQKLLSLSYDPEATKKELGKQGIPPYNKLYPPAPNKK